MTSNPELEVLVLRYMQTPDDAKFRAILTLLDGYLKVVSSRLYNHEEARADTYQELTIKVASLLNEYTPARGSFFKYLCCRMNEFQKNYYILLVRKAIQQRNEEVPVAEDFGTNPKNPHIFYIDALQCIPITDRRILELHAKGRTDRDIAKELNLSKSTIQRRRDLAIKRVRRMVDEGGDSEP